MRLEPTPDGQGPPPVITGSNSELIGDTHPPALRLLYTPRSQASNRRHIQHHPLPMSDFCTLDQTRHLLALLCRDEIFVSGYYWCSPADILDEHCVPWLDQNLDGPYARKQDWIAKLSFTLGDDTLAGFMNFYTSLRAGLNSCGFNPHLLPLLLRIRPGMNLVLTPIVPESVLVIGSGTDPLAICTPTIAYW
jgi:hypothetical protein